jgi:hypothetical protein
MSTLIRVTGQREWTGKYGPNVSIGLLFRDDVGEFPAELTCKPESLMARLEMLELAAGSEHPDWAFQSMGTWDDGKPKPRKVTNYPGKAPAPQSSGGGGRGLGGPPSPAAWRNTEAGAKYEQERMDRRTALMQAATACGPDRIQYVGETADEFYAWLRENVDQ